MIDDLRLAAKRLRNSPGFASVAILTLAVAVGANAAIFTVADAVLFRPLPYADPGRLFVIRSVDPATGLRSSFLPFEYVDAVRQHHRGVAGVALRSGATMTKHPGADGAEWMETLVAAPDYFEVLGVRPTYGRLFEPADAVDGPQRAVLTFDAWHRRFGGDASVVGREVRLGSSSRLVVGILPRDFIFPETTLRFLSGVSGNPQYVTVGAPPASGADPAQFNSIVYGGMARDAIVRLKSGVTRAQAQAELGALVAPIQHRRSDRGAIVLDDLRSLLFPTGRRALVLLLGAAALVLLIGCANLASMLAARTRRRERDIAVHAALGASRWRLVRPLLLEALMIGGIAAALAVAVTWLTLQALLREVPPAAYGRAVVAVDFRVALFALAQGAIGGILFACLPAWRLSRLDLHVALRGAGVRPGGGRLSFNPAIAAQVALALVLVVGAAASVRGFLRVLNQPLGFDPRHVILIDVSPGEAAWRPAQLRAFYDRVAGTLMRRGDVVSAGAGRPTPFDSMRSAEGPLQSDRGIVVATALPGYLESIGARAVVGRFPRRGDEHSDVPVAVLNESAARRLFPEKNPVGEIATISAGLQVTVIGVVEDEIRPADRTIPLAYVVESEPKGLLTIVVRTRAGGAGMLEEVRREVAVLAPPTEPVVARWMSDAIGALNAYRHPRFQSIVLAAFGLLALGLAALGIFAIVAAAVAARTREMGVRLALGASPSAVKRLVLFQALVPITVGIAAGAFASRSLLRAAQAFVAEFPTGDLLTMMLAGAVVAIAGLVAAYVPARRAARVDPIVVLRAE